MPSLIPEILVAVGKQIVEDGDSEAVIRFALSGKELLDAMKNVFTSVKLVKLHGFRYTIGWENLCCTFEFTDEKFHSKFLLSCIGNSVIDLQINYYFTDFLREKYKLIFDSIIASRQLVSFSLSVNTDTTRTYLDYFLPLLSSTLKNISIPSSCMTPTFRDSLNLDSLTILDAFRESLPLFCCKTTSITFTDGDPLPLRRFDRLILEVPQLSPALLSIKQVIFVNNVLGSQVLDIRQFEDLMKYFPSLEIVKSNIAFYESSDLFDNIRFHIKHIKKLTNIPKKIVIIFQKHDEDVENLKLDAFKKWCGDHFEFDASVSGLYCFRKNVQCASSKSTILEVQISKQNFTMD